MIYGIIAMIAIAKINSEQISFARQVPESNPRLRFKVPLRKPLNDRNATTFYVNLVYMLSAYAPKSSAEMIDRTIIPARVCARTVFFTMHV